MANLNKTGVPADGRVAGACCLSCDNKFCICELLLSLRRASAWGVRLDLETLQDLQHCLALQFTGFAAPLLGITNFASSCSTACVCSLKQHQELLLPSVKSDVCIKTTLLLPPFKKGDRGHFHFKKEVSSAHPDRKCSFF